MLGEVKVQQGANMPDVLSKQDGPILRVTLNQPDRGNAVSDGMVGELTGIIEGAEKTSSVVVLRGAGKDFCIGRAQMGSTPKQDPDALERRVFSDVVFNCYGALRNAKVPVVAVVQGRALGFGCAVAAACDITLASDQAVFQVPEMAHNILPTMVMSSFVDRVPRKAMSYLVYSTAEISPERALSFGIVSDVVPAAKLDEAVETLCAAILKAPRPAILGVKEYVKTAPDMAVFGAVEFARNLHATVNSSSEMRKKH
jgi:enoyl-CoA hydratase